MAGFPQVKNTAPAVTKYAKAPAIRGGGSAAKLKQAAPKASGFSASNPRDSYLTQSLVQRLADSLQMKGSK